jgi:V-type H+-transporting ATPase subunit G
VQDRTKRVKDARNEAQKEIEDYKKEKDAEYQKFEKEVCIWALGGTVARLTATQHSSGNQKAEDDAKKDTDVKVKEIEDIGTKSGGKVVDQLIAAVVNAKPEPPKRDWGSMSLSRLWEMLSCLVRRGWQWRKQAIL